MGFQGSLDTVGLTDIFQLFGFGRKSGALHLRNAAEHGVIHFEGGDVFYATMNPGEAIGNLLVRAELVTAEQWSQVLDDAADGRPQGEVLVTVEGIDTVAVEVFLRERVEDTVFRLAQWEGGEFELADEAHPFGATFRFETDPLLATAERRMDEWRRILEVVPSVTMGVQVVRDLPPERGEVTVTRDQWRLVAAVTPGSDVADVAAALGDTEFRTCETLAALVETGLVELVAPEKLAAIRSLLAPAPPGIQPSPDPAPPTVETEIFEAGAGPREDWVAEPEPESEPESEPDLLPTAEPASEAAPDDAPKLSLAELAAAAAEEPAPPPPAESGFALGDLATEYPPPEPPPGPAVSPVPVPEPVVQPFLDAVTPPPPVYTPPFDLAMPPHQAPSPSPYADVAVQPPPDAAGGTGEVPVVDFHQPGPADFATENPLGTPQASPPGGNDVDAATLAEAATGDSELDKSLILRLIAGVKSL